MRTAVFINIHSRRSRRVLDQLETDLADSQLKIISVIKVGTFRRFSTGVRRLRQIKRLDCVIVAGGDGTIAGVLNELHHRPNLHIGILPLGTGNSFARSLGIPLDYEQATTIIKAGYIRQPTLGSINGRIFINAAAIGLSAASAARISNSTKRYLGRLSYAISGAKHLLSHRAFYCELKTTKKTYRFRTHELLITNGAYHGGKVVDHHTTAYKKYLTFTALGMQESRWQYIISQWHIWRGHQRERHHLFNISAQTASVSTTPRRSVHADGEIIAETPAKFKIVPRAINVFVPKNY
jgi:diacylglycerol kinase (ATP)